MGIPASVWAQPERRRRGVNQRTQRPNCAYYAPGSAGRKWFFISSGFTVGRGLAFVRAKAGPARAMGAVSEGIADGLITVIWQPHHKESSAFHWHTGTSVADAKNGPRSDPAQEVVW